MLEKPIRNMSATEFNNSPLVYLPAVLAQVARLKRGKREREEKSS